MQPDLGLRCPGVSCQWLLDRAPQPISASGASAKSVLVASVVVASVSVASVVPRSILCSACLLQAAADWSG
ncbi:MAG TPA: hypothetical protein DIT89_00660 [Planctomycetaceae bacterium]|nr:hypothetical protein [Planctomycetaceae bacterium]